MSAGSGSGVEREIKIPVIDLGPVRSRLEALGARIEEPRAFERNRVFDRPGLDRSGDGRKESLLASGRLLRLREDGSGVRLTYKGVARFEDDAKVREEREVVVDSAETVARILEGVGFAAVKRYEKRRETWRLGDFLVALDETPIGEFVEIEQIGDDGEADRPSLGDTARELGLEPSSADPRSYLAIYEAWRAERPDAPADMVFPSNGSKPDGSSGGASGA